jgi:hypothetical protein
MENIKKSLKDLNLKVGTSNKDFEVSDVVYSTTNLNIFKFMVIVQSIKNMLTS